MFGGSGTGAVKRTSRLERALNFVFFFQSRDFTFKMDKGNQQSQGDPHKCVHCKKVNTYFCIETDFISPSVVLAFVAAASIRYNFYFRCSHQNVTCRGTSNWSTLVPVLFNALNVAMY